MVLLTLGLSEVWWDRRNGLALNVTPPEQHALFDCRHHDAADTMQALSEIVDLLIALRPQVQVVITVSPVPPAASFLTSDLKEADRLTKRPLVVAAKALSMARDQVEYFDSFERIRHSSDPCWANDKRHILERAIRPLVLDYVSKFALPPVVDVGFSEVAYLDANPDAEISVRLGRVRSGYQHWLLSGRERPLAPRRPTPRMLRLGAQVDRSLLEHEKS